MTSVLLAVFLLLIFLACLFIQKWSVLSPSVIFPFVFFVAVLNGLSNYERWSFDLSLNTCLVIGGGVFLFCGTGLIVHALFRKKVCTNSSVKLEQIHLSGVVYVLYIIMQIVVFVVTVASVINSAKNAGLTGNFLELFNQYADKSKHSTLPLGLPLPVNLANTLCQALGMILAFILANNISARKALDREDILPALALCTMIIGTTAEGSRGVAIMQVVALVTLCILMLQISNNGILRITKKLIAGCVAAVAIIAIIFFGVTLLRGTSRDLYYNLSVYLGAPIKNLDIYLAEPWEPPAIFGANFLYFFYGSIRKIFPSAISDYVLDNPYRSVNDLPLGNVHTTFYAFIHDFGYVGMIVLTIVMAIVMQCLFEFCIMRHENPNGFFERLAYITYGYLIYTIIFSFFSNKFYEAILRFGFIEFLVIWCIALYLINRCSKSNKDI